MSKITEFPTNIIHELNKDDITEHVMFIKVNGYHYGMTDFQLYDQTRRSWKVNEAKAMTEFVTKLE